jgi:hypothetical protein
MWLISRQICQKRIFKIKKNAFQRSLATSGFRREGWPPQDVASRRKPQQAAT